jgi:hypothetical protein
MELKNQREVEVTRKKLQGLQEHYDAARGEPGPLTRARQLSLQSIKRMINQMTEEIVRYEARATSKS